MDNEIMKTEQRHDVSIALIQKDVEYIKNSLTKIDTTLAIFDRNFARKEELVAIEKLIENLHKNVQADLATKVDRTDFDPIKKTLMRINWMVISAVVIGLLALIIKAG